MKIQDTIIFGLSAKTLVETQANTPDKRSWNAKKQHLLLA
jgi:hypothetical protein